MTGCTLGTLGECSLMDVTIPILIVSFAVVWVCIGLGLFR